MKNNKRILVFFDCLIWFLITAFPLLLALFYLNESGLTVTEFSSLFKSGFLDGAISTTSQSGFATLCQDFFASFGTYSAGDTLREFLPFRSSSFLAQYLNYFVVVQLCHVLIDIFLFVPKLVLNFLDTKFKGGD